MKLAMNPKIRNWTLAFLCLSTLAAPVFAQDDSDESTNTTVTAEAPLAPPVVDEPVSNATEAVESRTWEKSFTRKGVRRDAVVVIGSNAEVKEGETAEALVVIGGNGKVKGRVKDAAVVIGGNLEISGEVGDAAVAVMGSVTVRSNAVIHGDIVSVGGSTDVAEDADVKGQVQAVDFGGMGLPQVEPLREWFIHCALKLRPLSLKVGWIWIVVAVFLLVYVMVALLLHRPVQACVNELTRRPITTFFMGLLTKLLLPVVLIILAITVVGTIVIPFISAALLFGAIIGKVALLEYLGDSIRRAVGATEPLKPVVALLVGAVIITLFYLVPVLGLITFAVTGLWGLGIAVTTAFGSMKREAPEKPTPAPMAPAPMVPPAFVAPTPATPVAPEAFASTGLGPMAPATAAAGPGIPPQGAQAMNIPEAFSYPRAGFWERMGAAFLDIVIVGILIGFAGNFFHRLPPPLVFVVPLAYFAAMWTWKGTTIGGVVLNLKVVRYDGAPLTFLVALVRGLGAALSVVVMFLGFLWIAWDKDKQGWHDRIAGTVVVRLPRGNSLLVI